MQYVDWNFKTLFQFLLDHDSSINWFLVGNKL